MTKRRSQKLDIPDGSRRNFIKWSVGLGAALGLEPWKVFEVNESLFGVAHAADAACAPVNRFVGNVMGNGGFAWMTQLWPFTEQATRGNGSAFYATNQATDQIVEQGDHPMKLGPAAPNLAGRRITGFIAGNNETHTSKPNSAGTIDTGVGLFASVAAVQKAAPTLVPAISIGDLPFGNANGAPQVAAVPRAGDLAELFNSAASSAGGALQSATDARVFEAYYKANVALRRAATQPTFARGIRTGKAAAGLLGQNLADQLRPTADDLTRYGIIRGTPGNLQDIAVTLITTVKAFKLDLTSSVMLPGMNDDPHPAFQNLTDLQTKVQTLGSIWSAFMADLQATPDPRCGTPLSENTVIAWIGDTGKDPFQAAGWPDGTPQNSNWMYVMGNGYLRSGWFGQVQTNNRIQTWNPTTGANVDGGSSAAMARPASAAVLYAVAKGDMNVVRRYYSGPGIDGVVKPKTT